MNTIKAYVEVGQKRIFAGALDWPGWCRIGRDEKTALQALVDYGPRYAQALRLREIEFRGPADASELLVTERLPGNMTTDYGAPDAIPEADREPLDRRELERVKSILQACWQAFDAAEQHAEGKELRKGPRGGGRDRESMAAHVLGAEKAYLNRLGGKAAVDSGMDAVAALSQTRQAVLDTLDTVVREGLPERGPRGGKIWPVRYFIRRAAWHVLDHAWEIEDRIM